MALTVGRGGGTLIVRGTPDAQRGLIFRETLTVGTASDSQRGPDEQRDPC